ncbi:hypothetical protein J437_LFUL011522 [Ladona fulva]|uniref:Proline dehydrogenase n=1 Tax=Ladona fulva TaxID=123851 RepID=A0A8K0K9J2_LADFU|nr:hypothetical protein J437_LFUL011522 [Ladona fulva]
MLGERAVGWILRPTIYAQFVAQGGEEGEGLKAVADNLKDVGLHLMVAPTLEGDVGQGEMDDCYEKNLQELLHLADLAWEFGGGREERNPCLQVKATALLSADILRRVSKEFEEATISNKMKMVELVAERIISPSIRGDSRKTFPGISREVIEAFYKGARRLGILGQAAKSKGLHLLMDAEFTYVNPAVSLLALSAMAVINQNKPIVCHTLQCYLKNAEDNLKREIQIANALRFCYGAKIVRGAYLEQERRIASKESYDPTCASHADTGQNYKRVITHFMEYAAKSPPGNCFIVIATHNEAGICHALNIIHSLGLSKKDGSVAFAQIYGMAEQISMPLAKEGYIVYKSVPVGGLSQVLPYLARRAAENRSVLLGARKERELLQKELVWRIKSSFS